jgi:DamX protein
MVEHEDLIYQMSNQSLVDYSLISQERTDKLELLIHLLSNSTRAIVLCGPKGIGKTTLLGFFQQRHNESWQSYLILGREDLSFEQLQNRLHSLTSSRQDLIDFFEKLLILKQNLVLIIDDAGCLAPGLINRIIEFMAQHPALKVIFALTHDELAIKNRSDNGIEDCHIIEIPPLTERQCGDFLQHLAIKSSTNIPVFGITESMIADFYKQTHGIPEKIIAQLPELLKPAKKNNRLGWLLLILVLGLGTVSWYVLKILPDDSALFRSSLKSMMMGVKN